MALGTVCHGWRNRISGALSAVHVRAYMGWRGAMRATFYSSKARRDTGQESIEHSYIIHHGQHLWLIACKRINHFSSQQAK